jgi:cell division protease FtsH
MDDAMKTLRRRRIILTIAYALFGFFLLWSLRSSTLEGPAPRPVPYSELVSLLRAGKLESAEIRDTSIIAVLKLPAGQQRPERVVAERIPGLEDERLLEELEKAGVSFQGKHESTPLWQELLISVAPILLLVSLYFFSMRRMSKAAGPMSFGRNRAKIYDESQYKRVTFHDVAGVDEAEAELVEVVDFLKHPEKYRALGARIPKGVLLVGPPGTGKTLLARAVAGEAGVPFFSLSGSEFVEMFVGVGAARMRDLFAQAKERAPCIVFIDELDAIGRSRGGIGAMAVHDEREQTLNQLLVDMDGFDATSGVVIMAATNRPEVLDPALLRAGRFDRQVVVDRPDVTGRREILEIHTRGVKLGDAVELGVVARRTPGMVGADLANVVNEAALAAARRGARRVEQQDFEEAIDRILLGLKRRGRAMREEEKRRVGYHESGHALVALSVHHADPVHRVTIIPRSIGALGATLQLPTEDRYLVTRSELEDRICVMLGGRAAEELCCDDISTGAQNDLERATETARQMVCRFGMSERLGAVTFGRPAGARFLELPVVLGEERNFSEETARAIDEEVHRIVQSQHRRAVELLLQRREALERLAQALLDKETLERSDVEAILAAAPPAEQSSAERRPEGSAPVSAAPAGAAATATAAGAATETARVPRRSS